MTTAALPTLFVPHGAGPCFFMDWEPADAWVRMERWLRAVPELVGVRPTAVLVVSGHWEAPRFTVNAQERPPLLYDYHGFPPHTYALQYPAPGAPELAVQVRELLAAAGLAVASEHARGLDHGVFIPLMLIYPQADVPIVLGYVDYKKKEGGIVKVIQHQGKTREEVMLEIQEFYKDKTGRHPENYNPQIF